MHFDIETRDIHAEADRLEALGADRISEAPPANTAPTGW